MHEGLQFMKSIGSPAKNIKQQVDFAE